jgi:hypothetical protein
MMTLNREQVIAVGALGALLLVLLIVTVTCLEMRADAAQELDARNEVLSRLQARAEALKDARSRSNSVAPASAFLDAPTQGLAGSALQAQLLQLAAADRAVLISTGIEAAKREDPPDSIRLQAALDMTLPTLQRLLYQLESGTPYVYVESLGAQVAGGKAQNADDPLLHVAFGLRALWRRGGP